MLLYESAANASAVVPADLAMVARNSSTPSERVGPGSTEFTVTFVPVVSSASPREIASCAVFVKP